MNTSHKVGAILIVIGFALVIHRMFEPANGQTLLGYTVLAAGSMIAYKGDTSWR